MHCNALWIPQKKRLSRQPLCHFLIQFPPAIHPRAGSEQKILVKKLSLLLQTALHHLFRHPLAQFTEPSYLLRHIIPSITMPKHSHL